MLNLKLIRPLYISMTESRNVWNDASTAILLEEYEKNDFLWNSFNPLYTNKKKRQEGYNNIIKSLNSSVNIRDVKMKLKNLRSSYSLELKKIRDSRLNGDKEYVPKVGWFYKMDAFLRDVVIPQDSAFAESFHNEYVTSDPIEYKPLCSKLVTNKRKYRNTEDRKNIHNIEDVQSLEIEYDEPAEILPMTSTHLNHVQPSASLGDREDEFDAFGRNIAHQLRSIPLDVALKLQIKLQTIVAETRLSLYEHK